LLVAFLGPWLLVAVPASAKKPPPPPAKVFILVPGIASDLTQADIHSNFTPGFEAVKIAVGETVPDALFMTYSYNGPVGKKKPEPKPYSCASTVNNTIGDDILTLDKQVQAVIAKQSNAEIYLVAHSLGGVVAYGYMAALAEPDAAGTAIV
jgi:hypothetical protein